MQHAEFSEPAPSDSLQMQALCTAVIGLLVARHRWLRFGLGCLGARCWWGGWSGSTSNDLQSAMSRTDR